MGDVIQSRLNDSLARLDAAMGSPVPGTGRSSRASAVRPFTFRADASQMDVTSMLDGTALEYGDSRFGVSMMDSPSMVYEEVTAPVKFSMLGDPTMDISSAALLAQDDPGLRATQVLFSEFVNIMVSHPSEVQVWEELEAYEKACSQQVDMLAKLLRMAPRHHANFTRTEQVHQQLLNERNTWRLLGSLYVERMADESKDDSMDKDVSKLNTDQTIIDTFFDNNRTIKETQTVIDWLEQNASDSFDKFYDHVEYHGDNHIAYENTLKTLKSKQAGGLPLLGARALVTSLDPDATLRQGRPLHDLDQEKELLILRNVFAHVRSGQIELAQDLLVRSGQQWRAATLEGWRLHHDNNPSDPLQRNPIKGNPYRDVWKAVAWGIASDERVPEYERAIYGALCGHLDAVLNVCKAWEDVLWAYTKTLVDQWVEEQLRGATTHLRTLQHLPREYPEEKLTMEYVLSSVQAHPNIKHKNNPYHIIQKYIILDDVEGLMKEAHTWLQDNPAPHLLRCLTHLVLFLKHIGRISVQLEVLCTDILEACVKEAIERGDVEQVAYYTSVLPPWQQVSWYARFLHNISDDHHRRHALQLAAKVGLNTHAITAAVVTNIRLGSSSADPEGELGSESTPEDNMKISAMDWLLYDALQRGEAIRQANALMRSFLISRKISATRTLFNKIPTDSIDILIEQHKIESGSSELAGHQENIVREFFCMRAFLDAQDSFSDWFDHFHQKKPQHPKKLTTGATFPEQVAYEQAMSQFNVELGRWKHTLALLSKTAKERLYNVLLFPEGGWCVDSTMDPDDMEDTNVTGEGLGSGEADRGHQLSVLRSIYLPQVTALIQNILHQNEEYKECLQLSDLIASEQHQLYKAFGAAELQRFLIKLQETSEELLNRNCDALGYPLQ